LHRPAPPGIVGRINAETQKILSDAEFRGRSLDPYMFEPMSGSPAQFADYIRADVGKWDRVIRDANIKVE
jgi:tripartite-type tricarboxylate transporter receptor subunit TctC